MLPVSLNDLKGKIEGIKLRISDIFLKCLFLTIVTIPIQKCRKTHSRFAIYYAKIIFALSNLSCFLLCVSKYTPHFCPIYGSSLAKLFWYAFTCKEAIVLIFIYDGSFLFLPWGSITTEHTPHALLDKTGGRDLYLCCRRIFLCACHDCCCCWL